jgi:YD repeat-containing protein
MTAPNGVLTTLTYDARQRLTSRSTGGETTALSYYPTGLLKTVTPPDNNSLTCSYDGAHRLTQITDSLGNKIVFTLDAMGNRTAENTYDPNGTLHRTHSRVFNTLSELYQDINAANTAAVTTTYGYDSNGNQTSAAAPLLRNSGEVYDPLNRLKQVIDPANGTTGFSYDTNDNLTSVTDPRSAITAYTYNGFGELTKQVSPDTGNTTVTYDSGGNLATSTDARGAVSTYTYDALNRVTSVGYSLGGTTDQTIAFSYDAGPNGTGHLTGASDANHLMNWGYDSLGRVISKSQTVNGVAKSVAYTYTSGDLTTLPTPSGQTVTYGYNTNHQITSVAVDGTTVLNAVTYEPLGPVNGWTWGNATTTSRTYTGDGAISQISSNGSKTFTYDNALRITGISDTSTGSSSWTYGYDSLDRLTSGADGTITRGWTYDANGNRLPETGSSPSTYRAKTPICEVTHRVDPIKSLPSMSGPAGLTCLPPAVQYKE